MMPDHFIDNKPQELFRKLRIELGFSRQFAQPRNLGFFAAGIARRQGVFGFISANRFSDAKPFSQNVNQCGIDVVDTCAKAGERLVGRRWGWVLGHEWLASMTFCAIPLPALHLRGGWRGGYALGL